MTSPEYSPVPDEIPDHILEKLSQPTRYAIDAMRQSINYSRTYRKPRLPDNKPESDTEHSHSVITSAVELAKLHNDEYPDRSVDIGQVVQYLAVHDYPEIVTGDVATFHVAQGEKQKAAIDEDAAIEQLCKELPPENARLLREYHAQENINARFARHVEKHAPLILDLLGRGCEAVEEEYGVEKPYDLYLAHAKQTVRVLSIGKGEFPINDIVFLEAMKAFEEKYLSWNTAKTNQ